MSDHDASTTHLPEHCMPLYETPMEDSRHMPEDLASNLLWPDSEDLLHNIMSIDPTLWQQPLALAPSTVGLLDTSGDSLGANYQDSPGSSTIADDGRQAIQSLNSLLSDTVRPHHVHLIPSNSTSSRQSPRQQVPPASPRASWTAVSICSSRTSSPCFPSSTVRHSCSGTARRQCC